jgi:hypothetical protein
MSDFIGPALVIIGLTLMALSIVDECRGDDRVDANIVTGLDMSSSVDADEITIQVDGIIIAMQSSVVQSQIAHGRHHKIGFAVYVWANAPSCPVVVDWTTISSDADAVAMGAGLRVRLEAAVKALGYDRLTDLSASMLCGATLLADAPYAADRDVLNIVTNGTDNVGEEVDGEQVGPVRDLLVQQGININAVAMPGGYDHDELVPYLQQFVIGGPMPFLLQVDEPDDLTEAWRRKFIGDMS